MTRTASDMPASLPYPGRTVRQTEAMTVRTLSRRGLLGAGALATALLAACTRKTGAGATSSPTGPTAPPTSAAGTSSARPSATATPSLAQLATKVRGGVSLPGQAAYAQRVRLYNPRFDGATHPVAIAACTDATDVAACVRYAAETATPLAVRGGGHSYGGWSSGNGLVVNTAAMNSVAVDTATSTARIGAGALLADVYAQLGGRSVALAGGSCPTVGLTGLLLGGGVGVLTRAYGLTCDALVSAEVVTADGAIRTVDARHDPDLFWGLRGGGTAGLAVVTALTVALRPAPTVSTFFFSWDATHAEAVLTAWQHWIAGADERLWSTCKILTDTSPAGSTVTVSGTWIGAGSDLSTRLAPLLAAVGVAPAQRYLAGYGYTAAMLVEAGCAGDSAAACISSALSVQQRLPFAATSAILDGPLSVAGVQAAIAAALAVAGGNSIPDLVEGGVSFDSLGGAVGRLAPDATPFPHRAALASVQFTATWSPASGGRPVAAAAPFDSYVRAQRAALVRYAGNGAYANYADPAISAFGTAYWGANYARLQHVKAEYDPHGLFTLAQAVPG